MTGLGRSIRALRKKLGAFNRELSYGALAAELTKRLERSPPIAATTIIKWENGAVGGKGGPDPWALVEMARLASVSVEEFVRGPAEEPADARPQYERIAEQHSLPVEQGADAATIEEKKKAPAKGARASGKHRRHG